MHNQLVKLSLSLLIGFVCLIGDKFVQTDNKIIKAIADNLTHAIIGGLSWILVLVLSDQSLTKNLFNIFSAIIISSFIDLDHFIEAKDWRLNAATSLEKRPFLHSTTVPIIIFILLLICQKIFYYQKLGFYGGLIFTSIVSHHIRDGTRRGLWFSPFGSTPKIPYFLYIFMNILLPFFVYFILLSMNVFTRNYGIEDHVFMNSQTADS